MNYLIADLDCTLIKPITGQRPQNNNWELNVPIEFLKKFWKIYIVTNQADQRINLLYIERVKKKLQSNGLNVDVIINRKRDLYRKPHVMSFLEYIKKHLGKKDNITWIGDQMDDYNYYCNCLLHLKGYTGKYLYYDIKNLKTSVPPKFIEDNFKNTNITFDKDKSYIVYMYLLDMKSVFLDTYREFQIIKEYKKYYVLENKKENIVIYLGQVPHIQNEQYMTKYIINDVVDTERIARYYQ